MARMMNNGCYNKSRAQRSEDWFFSHQQRAVWLCREARRMRVSQAIAPNFEKIKKTMDPREWHSIAQHITT